MPDPPASDAEAVALRPVAPDDAAFLLSVYPSTRLDELVATDWPDEAKAGFCRQQFEAQTAHYQTHYPAAERSIILLNSQPAGRLYVDRWPREIRIMDIALLPEFRGKGAGSFLLTKLQNEAAAAEKLLSIHVERFNPALSLYARLGFVLAEDKGVYLLLHWEAEAASTPVR